MYRLFLVLLVWCTFICSVGAQTAPTTHIIERGETISSIAKQYNISEEKLLEANPDARELVYVGMQLTIPVIPDGSLTSKVEGMIADFESKFGPIELYAPDSDYMKYINTAHDKFNEGRYTLAASYFKKAIKLHPSADLYYNQALSYYNSGKYNKAIDAFDSCLSLNPDADIMSKSDELRSSAVRLRAERAENRTAVVASVLGIALVSTAAYLQASSGTPQTDVYTQAAQMSTAPV